MKRAPTLLSFSSLCAHVLPVLPSRGAARRLLRRLFASGLVLGLLLGAVRPASAEDVPEAFARVVVDEVELRSGPGATFRVLSLIHISEPTRPY